jgi:hypothetical protein
MQLLLLPKLGYQFAVAKRAVKTKVKRAKKNKHDDGLPSSKSSAWRTA